MSKQTSYIIAPSILAADCARMGEEATNVINAGADWLHIDVMDGHYVPNISFGPMICQSLRDYGISVPFDVHLMIKPVDNMISSYAKAGVNMISFHPEASEHVHRTIQMIKDHGCQVGIALNPATPLNYLDHIMQDIDMVLIMSVNPGFGGQKFIESSLEKIRQTREMIDKYDREIRLEVDGGVDVNNIHAIAQAGADTFVAGSAIFRSESYATTIQQMRNALTPNPSPASRRGE